MLVFIFFDGELFILKGRAFDDDDDPGGLYVKRFDIIGCAEFDDCDCDDDCCWGKG